MPDPERQGFCYAVTAAFFRFFFRVFFRLHVRGLDHVPNRGGCILVANHTSFLDPPVLGCPVRFRKIRFMARDSLFRYPVFGFFLRRFGVVPLRRDGGDIAALRTGIRVLRSGGALALFPEGTRSPDGRVQAVKGGLGFLVAHGRVPVIPAYIQGAFEAWPRTRRLPRLAPLTLTFGPPISPETVRFWQEGDNPYQAVSDRIMAAVMDLGSFASPGPRNEG